LDTPALFDPATSFFHLRNTNSPTDTSESVFGFGQPGGDWTPLVGDWNGNGAGGVGLYDPQSSLFYLTNQHTSGTADYTFGYGAPNGGWIPLVGDWNGDGAMGVGLYDPHTSIFYLTNALSTGKAEYTFGYGQPNAGWIPLVGDWDGNGTTGVGLYDPHTSIFYLTNTLSTGVAQYTFGYGAPNAGWTPLVGDWNADHAAGVGLYDPNASIFYLTNQHQTGKAEYAFGYGAANAGWQPLVGDWNADGATGVGLYDPAGSTFYLTNSLTTGSAQIALNYGTPGGGWEPLAGAWQSSAHLFAAGDPSPLTPLPTNLRSVPGARGTITAVTTISTTDLAPIIQAALARWSAAGVSQQSLEAMTQATYVVTDLPGAELGQVLGGTVYLDRNAAGHGWFVDPTPAQDEEFARVGRDSQLEAIDPQAVDHIDLVTVVEHELGHVAGLDDLAPAGTSLMSGVLPTGVRRSATVSEVDAIFAPQV